MLICLLTQWDCHGNEVTVGGGHRRVSRVTRGQVGGADDVTMLRPSRWRNKGRSQTRLRLTGLHLHTWWRQTEEWDRKQEERVRQVPDWNQACDVAVTAELIIYRLSSDWTVISPCCHGTGANKALHFLIEVFLHIQWAATTWRRGRPAVLPLSLASSSVTATIGSGCVAVSYWCMVTWPSPCRSQQSVSHIPHVELLGDSQSCEWKTFKQTCWMFFQSPVTSLQFESVCVNGGKKTAAACCFSWMLWIKTRHDVYPHCNRKPETQKTFKWNKRWNSSQKKVWTSWTCSCFLLQIITFIFIQ